MDVVTQPLADPELALALRYAPAAQRAALTTLFELDARLRRIALAAREPMIRLMRLTWWRDALTSLDAAPAPAEPLLRSVAATLVPGPVRGAGLSALTEGWERVVEGEPNLAAYAAERGGRLFTLAASVLGETHPALVGAGEGWALADLARGWPDLAEAARGLAAERLTGLVDTRWPRALRPLGALALLARSDLAGGVPGSPARVGRLLLHRLSGR